MGEQEKKAGPTRNRAQSGPSAAALTQRGGMQVRA
jgi:hypothetical protein